MARAGRSTVRRVLAAAAPVAACLVLAPGATAAGTLGGVVWSDRDGDGVRERGEPGVRGVAVAVQRATRSRGPFRTVATRRTSSGGTWSIRIARSGLYRVRLAVPAGRALSPADRGRDTVDSDARLSRGVALTKARRLTRRSKDLRLDVGLRPARASAAPPLATSAPSTYAPSSAAPSPSAAPPAPSDPSVPGPPPPEVTGRVWVDADDDGQRDPVEAPRAGIVVEAWNAARTTKLGEVTSSAAGTYAIPVAVEPGTPVRVRLVLPAQTIYAKADQGPDATDSDIASSALSATGFSASAPAPATFDAGIRTGPLINVGGSAWEDDNQDGVRDAGETAGSYGADQRYELWNAGMTQRLDAVGPTSSSGVYSFSAVSGGTYRLVSVSRSGFRDGLSPRDNSSTTDALDSDFEDRPASSDFRQTAAFTPTASTSAWDAGLGPWMFSQVKVFSDAGDGIQGVGGADPGIAGVQVQRWNHTMTQLTDIDVSDATGVATLEGRTGQFRLRVLAPTGYAITAQDQGADDTKDSDFSPVNGFTPTLFYSSAVIQAVDVDAGLTGG